MSGAAGLDLLLVMLLLAYAWSGWRQGFVAALLGLTGLLVDAVGNGKEAVGKVSAGDYALVLMDMQMPVMGGLEATRAIRQLPGKEARPFVLAMTANAFDEDKALCNEAGMDAFLTKPIAPAVLYTTLLKYLDQLPGA